MILQTAIDFPAHSREKTAEGTAHVKKMAVKIGGNMRKIMRHFQNGNVPLTDETARTWQHLRVRNLAQRIADLRTLHLRVPAISETPIVILSNWVEGTNYKKYRLGCTCKEPGKDTDGCWLHSEKLKVL